MIADSLKEQVTCMTPDGRRELMEFMVVMQIKDDPEYRKTLTERIDDNNADNWVSLEELDAKLEEKGDE